MPRDAQEPSELRSGYWKQTHSPLHALAFLVPLLVFFHVGAAYYGVDRLLAVKDLQSLAKVLGVFGPTVLYLPPLLLAGSLLVQQLARKDPWSVHVRVLAGMLGESIAWALPLVALNLLFGSHPLQAGADKSSRLIDGILYAIGAGVYEEFIFRLLFIGLTLFVLSEILHLRRDVVAVAAIAASAICFALYHFKVSPISGQQAFRWDMLVYLASAGAYLGWLYLFRGFAIAVGAHATLNILKALLDVYGGAT